MIRALILCGVGAFALSGCTTISGAPPDALADTGSALRVKVDEQAVTRIVERELDAKGNITQERTSERVEILPSYRTLSTRQEIIDHSLALSSEGERQAFRNRVIDHYMGEMDRHYETFSQRLFNEGIQLALGFDSAIIGLASAAALFEDSATDLASVISGFAGIQSAIDKNLYFDRTLPALVATMDAERTRVETGLVGRKGQGYETYSLEAAIRDLRRYQQAGTLLRAITQVTEQASTDKASADEQAILAYERQLGFTCEPEEALLDSPPKLVLYFVSIDSGLAARDAAQKAKAEGRLRSLAAAMELSPQGSVDDVRERIARHLSEKMCTVEQFEAMEKRLTEQWGIEL
jgi:hypothetical protein